MISLEPDCQDLPERVSPVADAAHWSDWIGNFIDWVEDMDEDKRIVIENLTTRYPGTEQPQLRQINAEVHTGQVVGIIGNSHSGKSLVQCASRGHSQNCVC